MKNLLNFFFSFDKLFKEKLVVPFFWLALIVWALGYSAEALDTIALDPLAKLIEFVGFFAEVLLVLILIRIISEIFVAIFRINDNLSPDGGRAELADIDPVAEARRAAELAAARTREMTKSATDRTRRTLDDVRDQVEDTADTISDKAKTITKSGGTASKSKTDTKTVDPKSGDAPLPVKALEPSAIDGASLKRGRGRPKGSKNKPKTTATTASKTTSSKTAPAKTATAKAADGQTPAKRGPGRPKGSRNKPKAADGTASVKRSRGRPKGSKNKPKTGSAASSAKPGPRKGVPVPRDADGNLLKKDGTPRKKPGPKPKG